MTYPPGPGQNWQYPPMGDPGQGYGQVPGYGQPQYPGYPQPGFPGQYPPPPPKKQHIGLWIGLAALVVVIVTAVGLAVAFWPSGSRSSSAQSSSKPALTGRPQADYVALLPKQEDFGPEWTVSDDSTADSPDVEDAGNKMLSRLTATPSGCGLADLADKAKSMSDKTHTRARVKGERSGGGSSAPPKTPTDLTVAISDSGNYDESVQALREYIAKCSSSTMQGSMSDGSFPMSVTMKISITETRPPASASDKSFGLQMKSTMSLNTGGDDIKMELSEQVYAALVRGVVVSTTTNDLGQSDLEGKLFAATVERVNKA